jgi:hypothetical protein
MLIIHHSMLGSIDRGRGWTDDIVRYYIAVFFLERKGAKQFRGTAERPVSPIFITMAIRLATGDCHFFMHRRSPAAASHETNASRFVRLALFVAVS